MLVLLPLLIFGLFYLTYNTMDNNYSVYQHVTPDGLYYFGQTNNIKRRWSSNGIQYKGTSLYPYIEKFGWDNIQHIVLFENQTRENALWIEDFLIETAREDGVCINQQRSGLVSKNKDYKQNYYRDYDQKRSEKRRGYKREYNRQYYEQNRDEILDKQRQYYEKNRDEKLEKQRQRYQENLSKNREKNRIKQQKYRQRKKEEKQFRELGYVPLF